MQIKDYYVPVIHSFDFIDSEEETRESIKTVLGVLATSVSEEMVRDFSAQLPDWLDYDALRGENRNTISRIPADCKEVLKEEYGFDDTDAEALMYKVVAITVQNSTGNLGDLILELPDEWEEVFNQSPKRENVEDEPVI
ncbi:DUF2267 domain-containing protein [Rhodohalobacter mucosus]|nr:DUF2267 domain-containing protein [Rhodohalobacter mucosus]